MTIMTLNNDSTTLTGNGSGCGERQQVTYDSIFGFSLAMPEWEAIGTALLLTLITLITIVGNILVILSVFTYKPLRIVQNFFIVSLAVADLTVATLVLPLNVAYYVRGQWDFGIHVCKMWLTSDVLCCTASILHLCVIALDRYWAITDPINYAQKRNVERVLFLIAGVWVLSFIISSPPLLGWNDWPSNFDENTACELTSQQGYVVYSALGSFFIPLVIMTIVYIEIFVATRRRLRERAQATKINAMTMKSQMMTMSKAAVDPTTQQNSGGSGNDRERESISSEMNNHNETAADSVAEESKASGGLSSKFRLKRRKKDKKKMAKDSIKDLKDKQLSKKKLIVDENSVNDAQEHDDDDDDDDCDDNNLNNKGRTNEKKVGGEDDDVGGGDSGGRVKNGITENKEAAQNVGDGSTIKMTNSSSVIEIDKKNVNVNVKNSNHNNNNNNNNNCQQKKAGGVYQFIEEKQKISLTRERRAARTLGIIMGVFVVCWLPFFLMYVIVPFCESCCPSKKLVNFITWLGYINSSLNPIIYTVFNLEYRRAFKKLLGIKR